MLFEQKKSDFLPGMFLGVAVGGVVAASGVLMSDKKNRDALKKTANQMVKKVSDTVNRIGL